MRQTIDIDIAGAEEAEAGGTATTAGATAVYGEEHDLPTNRLQSGQLHQSHQPHSMTPHVVAEDEADREWLTHLTARALTGAGTQGQAGPASSGMAQHSAPAAMVPTFGARASRMLGRVLVMAVYLLVIGVVATGAYLLTSATWTTGPKNTGLSAGSGSPSVGADSSRQGQDVGRPQARNPQEQQPAQRYGPGAGSGTTGSNSNSNSNSGTNAGNDGMVVVPVAGTPAQLRDKGLQAYRAGNYERAITLLEQAVNLDGGDALTYYQLGLAYMAAPQREHAMEDAELAFRTAASLQPEWGAPYVGLAESLLRRDLYRDAIAPALQATRLEPRSVEAWLALGRAYKGAGQEAEATRAFAEAARLAPAPPAQP